MSGNFLSCSKGVKDPLEVPEVGVISLETSQRKWASSRLEGRTYWIFSSCGRCSRLSTRTSGTRSGSLRKGQSPCELREEISGFLSRRCRGLKPCVESLLEPEDSPPVLTWILGNLWSLPRGVSRSTPRSMSALERNPQVPATTPHKVLGLGISGRAIPRGPLATRIGTGLS